MKNSLFIYFLLILSIPLSAQIIGSKTDSTGQVWNIRFITDVSPVPIWYGFAERYQGEFYKANQQWEWRETDSSAAAFLPDDWVYNVRLGTQLNLVGNLYLGANYSAYIVRRQTVYPNGGYSIETIPFITLNASVSYPYQLPFAPKVELLPTIAFGRYQSDGYSGYEGLGQEWSMEGRMGIGLKLKRHPQQIRFWASYARMWYNESQQSFVYPERQRQIETMWQFVNVGVGLVWHLRIEEDR